MKPPLKYAILSKSLKIKKNSIEFYLNTAYNLHMVFFVKNRQLIWHRGIKLLNMNKKSIFRFITLLSLFYILIRGYTPVKQGKPASQDGVGGGIPADQVIMEMPESTETLETVLLEPELFSPPRVLLFDTHIVKEKEVVIQLAERYGLNQDTIISANKITNTRTIQVGKALKIPNQDGVIYTVKSGDTLSAIVKKYEKDKLDISAIKTANELFSESIRPGTELFIPGAKIDSTNLSEINGDLFFWPVSGYITSSYGYRRSPFSGAREFHSGMDIRANFGTPIRSAMSGRVSSIGSDNVLGNYVVISHHSGYRTLYGHMSVIRVKNGAYVGTGERIGDVGSTGMSTGPHVHFTVYKNGVTMNPRVLMK
jgi:murein DD-endopeptidase MepM/ murein hydrolase activator NlpD